MAMAAGRSPLSVMGSSQTAPPRVAAPFTITLEAALYALILIAAMLTRFWDLGSRALHHDESLHAYFSWLLATGQGYTHDPLMHGPFLFHVNALVYALLGDSDASSRYAAALFGVILVALPILLRGERHLGRWGALAASTLFLISPALLYQSRYIRHDIFTVVGALFLFIAIVRYIERPARGWLVAIGATLGFLLTNHEIVFGIVAIFCRRHRRRAPLGAAAPDDPARDSGRHRRAGAGCAAAGRHRAATALDSLADAVAGAAVRLLPRTALPPVDRSRCCCWRVVTLAAAALIARTLRDPERREEGWAAGVAWRCAAGERRRGGASGVGAMRPGSPGRSSPGWRSSPPSSPRSSPISTGWPPAPSPPTAPSSTGWASTTCSAASSPGSTTSCSCRSTSSWPHSSDLPRRSSSACRAVMVGIGKTEAGPRFVFQIFLALWFAGIAVALSFAGEKMPWLVIHITLPATLLAAGLLGELASRWRPAARVEGRPAPAPGWGAGQWALFAGLIGLAACWFLLAAPMTYGEFVSSDRRRRLGAGAERVGRRTLVGAGRAAAGGDRGDHPASRRGAACGWPPSRRWRRCVLTLALAQVHVAWRLVYREGDVPKDMLVYTQTSPDMHRMVEELTTLSAITTGGRDLEIWYDDRNGTSWPMQWYLRDFPNRHLYGGTIAGPPDDVPVVLVARDNRSSVEPYLEGYTAQEYVLRWWFPEEIYRDFAIAPEISPSQSAWGSADNPHGPGAIAASIAESLSHLGTHGGSAAALSAGDVPRPARAHQRVRLHPLHPRRPPAALQPDPVLSLGRRWERD